MVIGSETFNIVTTTFSNVVSTSFIGYFTLGSGADAYANNWLPTPGQFQQSDITKQSCLRITFPK
jgi:hypothetical protein